jgi:hypothetical protein
VEGNKLNKLVKLMCLITLVTLLVACNETTVNMFDYTHKPAVIDSYNTTIDEKIKEALED